MHDTIIALIGYIAWTLFLLLGLAVYRSYLVFSQQHGIGFKADGSDVTGFAARLTRALANCIESFAFIGGLMLLSLATDSHHMTDPLALWLLAARLGQSIVHLISVSALAIQIRFAFFLLQFAICVYWTWLLWQRFA